MAVELDEAKAYAIRAMAISYRDSASGLLVPLGEGKWAERVHTGGGGIAGSMKATATLYAGTDGPPGETSHGTGGKGHGRSGGIWAVQTQGLSEEYLRFRRYAQFSAEVADFALAEHGFFKCVAEARLLDSGGLGRDDAALLFAMNQRHGQITFDSYLTIIRIVAGRLQRRPSTSNGRLQMVPSNVSSAQQSTPPAPPTPAQQETPTTRRSSGLAAPSPAPAKNISRPSSARASRPSMAATGASTERRRGRMAPPVPSTPVPKTSAEAPLAKSRDHPLEIAASVMDRVALGQYQSCLPNDAPLLLHPTIKLPSSAPQAVIDSLERCRNLCDIGRMYRRARSELKVAKDTWVEICSRRTCPTCGEEAGPNDCRLPAPAAEMELPTVGEEGEALEGGGGGYLEKEPGGGGGGERGGGGGTGGGGEVEGAVRAGEANAAAIPGELEGERGQTEGEKKCLCLCHDDWDGGELEGAEQCKGEGGGEGERWREEGKGEGSEGQAGFSSRSEMWEKKKGRRKGGTSRRQLDVEGAVCLSLWACHIWFCEGETTLGERALAAARKWMEGLPGIHPYRAVVYAFEGVAAFHKKQYHQAFQLFSQANTAQQTGTGMAVDPETAEAAWAAVDTASHISNLAACCHIVRERHCALSLYDEALDLLRKHVGPGHPRTQAVLQNRIKAYRMTTAAKPAWYKPESSLSAPVGPSTGVAQPSYGLDKVRAAAAGALGKGVVGMLGMTPGSEGPAIESVFNYTGSNAPWKAMLASAAKAGASSKGGKAGKAADKGGAKVKGGKDGGKEKKKKGKGGPKHVGKPSYGLVM